MTIRTTGLALLALGAGALGCCTCQRDAAGPAPRLAVSAHPDLVARLGSDISAVARSADGQFAVGLRDGRVLLGRPAKGQLRELQLRTAVAPASAAADAGRTAVESASRAADAGGRAADTASTGGGAAAASVHDGALVALAFSQGGQRLFSVGGHVAAAWDTARRRLIRRVRGPQLLTSGVLLPAGTTAFFGTIQGHVMRWSVERPSAQGVRNLSCGGTRVAPARMRLPKTKRCPYGRYVEPDEGPPACLYPVTQLVLVGQGALARACRTGEGALMDLRSRKLSFFTPGHLSVLVPVGRDALLAGRADGELRLLGLPARQRLRRLEPAEPASAAASDGTWIAALQGQTIRLWHRKHPAPVAAVALPRPGLWLGLQAGRLQVVLEDGALQAYRLIPGS